MPPLAALLLAAAACAVLGDEALCAAGVEGEPLPWLRWPVSLALLFAVVTLFVHAPADHQPPQWVTFGSVGVVALTYLYLAAAAVLMAAQLDGLVRERVRKGATADTVAA